MPKDGAGLLCFGANSYCTNLFLVYVVQPKLQGCFFPFIDCDSTEGWHPFVLFHSTQTLDMGGIEKKLLENLDVYLYRTKGLRIRNDGRRHFQILS